jgi:hypothetical protein
VLCGVVSVRIMCSLPRGRASISTVLAPCCSMSPQIHLHTACTVALVAFVMAAVESTYAQTSVAAWCVGSASPCPCPPPPTSPPPRSLSHPTSSPNTQFRPPAAVNVRASHASWVCLPAVSYWVWSFARVPSSRRFHDGEAVVAAASLLASSSVFSFLVLRCFDVVPFCAVSGTAYSLAALGAGTAVWQETNSPSPVVVASGLCVATVGCAALLAAQASAAAATTAVAGARPAPRPHAALALDALAAGVSAGAPAKSLTAGGVRDRWATTLAPDAGEGSSHADSDSESSTSRCSAMDDSRCGSAALRLCGCETRWALGAQRNWMLWDCAPLDLFPQCVIVVPTSPPPTPPTHVFVQSTRR